MKVRFRLENFIRPNQTDGRFAAARILCYRETQDLLLDNYESRVRAIGLKSIFYARFSAVRGLIPSRCYSDLVSDSEKYKKLENFLLNQGSVDHLFKKIADSNIRLVNERKYDQAREILAQDTFKDCLTAFFKGSKTDEINLDHEGLVSTFMDFEKQVWKEVRDSKKTRIIFD